MHIVLFAVFTFCIMHVKVLWREVCAHVPIWLKRARLNCSMQFPNFPPTSPESGIFAVVE